MQALSPIKTSNFLHASKRLHELTSIRSTAITLLKYKKDRLKLEKKYEDTKNKFATKQKILDKEKKQETKKISPKKSKLLKKSEKVASIGIIDLLITFAKIKALMWIGDPENLAKVQAIVKGLTGVFKFIDWFATGAVTNLLDGLHKLLFGGSILERIFGLFSAIVGFFGIRYLLNPFKLIKDLKFVIKNGDKIGQIFNAFKESGIKKGAADLAQKLTKTADIFKRGLGRGLGRAILKVFGKNGLKFLTKAVAPAVGGLTKLVGGPLKAIATKTVGGIPIVGPLLNLGINLLLGDPLDKALFKTVGSTLGMGLGAFIGSVFPGPGTIVGGALGGILGDWASSTLYDWMKGAISKKEEPALAVGGIVTKPTRALIGEAGPEAVIPLPKIYDGTILNAPMGIVASSMIGGIDAVISSLGPVGLTIRPYASSLLAPYRREFGSTNYVFTSNIGGKTTPLTTKLSDQNDNEEVAKILGLNKTVNLIKKKEASEEAKKARYNSGNSVREILGDILNNIINLDFTKKSKKKTRPGDTTRNGDIGEVGGEVDLSDADDRTLLKQLALAEAAGEGVVGMALVVNSVLNRKRILDGGASPGLFHATDKTIRGIIYAKDSVQYTPVQSGTINKQWGEGSLNLAEKALQMGMDKSKLRQALEAEGVSENSIKFLINSTGFRNYDAGAKNDKSQKVNETVYKRHTFNTAGVPKMQQGGLVSRGDITSKFGNKESFRKNSHEGIDIAFPSGTPLSFTLGGKFLKVSRSSSKEREANGGYGQYMDLKLSDGKIARLAHLSSIPNWVKQGGDFTPNAIVALSGGAPGAPGSGRSGGPHLHLEQHTTQKDLAETLNGKVDPLSQGLFGLLRKGGSPGSATSGPAQPSQSPAASPDTVKESEETQQESQPPPINYDDAAKNLGQLFQMLTGTPKTNGFQLQKDSMDYVQAFKDFKPNPDTYIMMGGTNIISSTTLLAPIEQLDYSSGSFSNIDSVTAFKLNTRL